MYNALRRSEEETSAERRTRKVASWTLAIVGAGVCILALTHSPDETVPGGASLLESVGLALGASRTQPQDAIIRPKPVIPEPAVPQPQVAVIRPKPRAAPPTAPAGTLRTIGWVAGEIGRVTERRGLLSGAFTIVGRFLSSLPDNL